MATESQWLFEPLSPTQMEVANLDNLFDEEDILNEALVILNNNEHEGQRRAEREQLEMQMVENSKNDMPESDFLLALPFGLEQELVDKPGYSDFDVNLHSQGGDIKRVFSPVKAYDREERGSPQGPLLSQVSFEGIDLVGDKKTKRGTTPKKFNGVRGSRPVGRPPGTLNKNTAANLAAAAAAAALAAGDEEECKVNGDEDGNEGDDDKDSGNVDPWPSAKDYVSIVTSFLDDPTRFTRYTTSELGKCKLTGTPLQPEWLYTEPRTGIYFIQCDNLRGKGSFGFPKCETIGKKTFEWKKTSYLNNVPKAKPVISYITANGNGKDTEGNPISYRMRIIKAINLDHPNAAEAEPWCLVDIHKSLGLARRVGPRPGKKQDSVGLGFSRFFPISGSSPVESVIPRLGQPSEVALAQSAAFKQSNNESASEPETEERGYEEVDPDQTRSAFSHVVLGKKKSFALNHSDSGKTRPSFLNTDIAPNNIAEQFKQRESPAHLPLSPLKRLSLLPFPSDPTTFSEPHAYLMESPKGKKMQRIDSN